MTARTDLLAQAKAQKDGTSEATSSSTKGNGCEPPAKKRKTAAKEPQRAAITSKTVTPATEPQFKGKRRNAKLAHVTEMPLDVLFEIFGFLHPLDLLYLARANKVLRGVVMSRQALGVWKKAFQTAEVVSRAPPPPPDSISLPQYTAMLYDHICQVCGSRFGNMVHWLAGIRFCAKCVDERFVRRTSCETQWSALCRFQDFRKVRIPGTHYGSESLALKTEYQSRKQEIESLLKDGQDAQAEALRSRWTTESSNAYADTRSYRSWESFVKQQGNRSREQKVLARRKAIDAKVRAEGYANDIGWYGRLQLPAYRKLATLTDKEWINIKNDVLSVFAYRQQQRDYENLRRQYSTSVYCLHRWLLKIYAQSASSPMLVPTSADVAKSEPFRTLIQVAADASSPLVEEQLLTLKDNVPNVITTWNDSAMQLLIGLLPAPPKRSKLTGEDRLSLATTFFKCHWCTEPISYPRILMHSCVRSRRIQVNETENQSTDGDSEEEGDEEDESEADDQQTPPIFIDSSPETMWRSMSEWYGSQWNEGGEQITFDDEASQVARNILLACNYPPETTLMSTVDDDSVRMECTRCYKTSKKPQRLVMNWKQAISHDLKKHFTDGLSPGGWKLVVDEHDLATVREKEATQQAKGRYRCKSCATLLHEYTCRSHTIYHHEIPRDTLPANQREFIETYYTPDIDQSIRHSLPLPVKL